MGDWTRSLLQLVQDGRDDHGRVSGPCHPWWGLHSKSKGEREAALEAAERGAAAAATKGCDSDGSPKRAPTDAGDAACSDGMDAAPGAAAATSGLYPTIYLEGPYGAPAQAYTEYDTLLLVSTGVGCVAASGQAARLGGRLRGQRRAPPLLCRHRAPPPRAAAERRPPCVQGDPHGVHSKAPGH